MSSLPHHLRTLLVPWNGSGDIKKAALKNTIYIYIYVYIYICTYIYISLSTLPSLPPNHFLAEWWFPNSWMVYFMKNPIKMDDLGGTPMTSETKPCPNIPAKCPGCSQAGRSDAPTGTQAHHLWVLNLSLAETGRNVSISACVQ